MYKIICKKCNENMNIKTLMHYKIRDFLVTLNQYDFDYVSGYDSKVTEKVCMVCFNLLKEYIKLHSNKSFKSTKILHGV